jgi:ribulose-bisphosphate carboxylase large chain
MSDVLFLAGSAINSIKNASGKPDPKMGTEAMMQALELYRSGELAEVSPQDHLRELTALASGRKMTALLESLRQRYPEINP